MVKKVWSVNPKPAKLTAADKRKVEAIVKQALEGSPELNERVHRFEVRAGRIHLYHLREHYGWDKPDFQFIEPLIEGKYTESLLARITLFDTGGNLCEAAYKRHTGGWVSVHEGSITSCLDFIEVNDDWFL